MDNGINFDDLKNIYGPTALITGASSGIGEQFAVLLAKSGFDLILVARRGGLLNALAERLSRAFSTSTIIIEDDLSDPNAVDRIMEASSEQDVGLLVSNAGFGLKEAHQNNDPSRMTEMLMVNCHAPMQLTHRFIPRLRQRDRSGILLTSSVEGLMGFPNSTPYAATKAFVNSLAEGLWGELCSEGVDVCAICPGSTDTQAHELQGVDRSKVGEMMHPGEVVKLALNNIEEGPVYIVGEQNEEMFKALTQMPRRDALPLVGETMNQSLLESQNS